MTKLYALDLRRYENGRWRDLLPQLPAQRRERALSCRFEPDKARIAGGGWLLQKALMEAGVDARAQVFDTNEYGKPYLPSYPHIHFSLSHSGIWAVCAVSDQPVGVDVELPRCRLGLAKRYFHPSELEGVEQMSRLELDDYLNRLWTGKEAFLKMLGCGVTVPLDSVVIHPGETVRLEQPYTDKPYHLYEYRLGLYRLCLCAQGIQPPLEVIE